ncbi:Putative major facilitator superfamily, MFS transporter superfamily [Septoria linicola]|uniref:Major facilitator superfamily, MFS transporter superfamily n=1 Tax=Septoria linicola TaxID=215465 RepID=A0A9Q9AMZ9_9PEZI|nr:Putative major facilitator superfamily, MFS transporter superfamily [Septoria linicola]
MTPLLTSPSEKKNKHDTALRTPRPPQSPHRKAAEYWQAVYEESQYECREAFDPTLEWDAKEERKIVRKLDWHVCTWACVMFFALQVDRGNLKQAVSADMLEELSLSTNEYNYGNTIFLLSFLLAELPSQLISKAVGPDRWVPMQMLLWSVVAAAQASIQGKASFYACRALIGMLEGGFIPDLVLWLSYFYTSSELPIRLSFFWTALDVTSILTSLLAFGLLRMDGIHSLSGWRWLFLVEGLLTFAIGAMSFFLMPSSAVATKTWFRPKGWFTDREVGVVVNRVLRDDPSKGDMHNRMAFTAARLWRALSDYDMWPIYLIGLIVYIPMNPVSNYITISLRQLGFSTFHTNLLVIPHTVASVVTLIGLTWISERINERSLIAMIQNVWVLPCLLALRFWPGSQTDPWGTYALITTLLAYPYCHAIMVGWASRNSGSVRTRSISAACYNICVQLGNVAGSNIYRTADSPLYRRGNSILIGLNVIAILIFPATKLYYKARNNKRERRWQSMSEEQKKEYLDSTTDEGNKRLDFRFGNRILS